MDLNDDLAAVKNNVYGQKAPMWFSQQPHVIRVE